jgi:adenylate kinase
MFVVFLGLPGTGKGTQCSRLKESIGFSYLSPGEVIRQKLNSGDDDVKMVADLVNSGNLLSDDFIMKLVENSLKVVMMNAEGKKTLIFDGIPRTLVQAQLLDDLLLKNFQEKVELVVCLSVKKRTILKRLQSRVICKKCGKTSNLLKKRDFQCDCGSLSFVRRKDDNESIIRKRLKNDKKHMVEIYNYYLSIGTKCCKVDGDSNQSVVFKRLKEIMCSNII